MFLESWEKVLQGFILILGVKGNLSSWEVMKGQNPKKINLHQMICFWKPETELEMDLLEYLKSEVIRGHWRSLKVVGCQHNFHNSWICWMCFSDDLCFVPHLYLIWGTWGTYVYMYLILRYIFHSPKETSRREWSLVPVKMSGAHQTL